MGPGISSVAPRIPAAIIVLQLAFSETVERLDLMQALTEPSPCRGRKWLFVRVFLPASGLSCVPNCIESLLLVRFTPAHPSSLPETTTDASRHPTMHRKLHPLNRALHCEESFPRYLVNGNATSESGAMESAEGAWPTKANVSGPKVLCTHLIRRHLLHRLQRKQGPKVDAERAREF
jgi:hypothetical protein